jgi:RiboL-PSP-HEPN
MPTFEETIHDHFDSRTSTLGGIKARSIGADTLTLTALNVLVYAQLEGGIKDLASCVLRDLNRRRLTLGEIKPGLLRWRNPNEINRFKAMVDFNMITTQQPFAPALGRRAKIAGINRLSELNQMGWEAIRAVYKGLGVDHSDIELLKSKIDQIVDDRNEAAHYGVLPTIGTANLEHHVRDNVGVVENVLTDLSLRILPFFSDRLHLR